MVWMVLQISTGIQGHPYPLQTENPVEGLDWFGCILQVFVNNSEPSMMQNEKIIRLEI